MIAVLIIAGRSTRFWPLGEKNFFPVAGSTLAEIQVSRIAEARPEKIIIVAGAHNMEMTRTLFPKLEIIEQEDLSLGMRGALLSALPSCGEKQVLVVSGNDVIETSAYEDLMTKGEALKEGGLILAKKVDRHFPGGYLAMNGKAITKIVEKPAPGTEPSDMVNIVAHVHARADTLLAALKKVRPTADDGYEVALSALCNEYTYEAVPYEGVWQPVKYPWHLLSLLSVLLPSDGKPVIPKSAKVHKSAVIEGAVILGENVKVMAHASVMGPCIIGDGTIIANNALVRGSSVGKNCVIGYSTEVARSVVGNDVWTHSSYVGDSVLGSNVSLGGGTVTGNLRLDEEEITSVVREKPIATGLNKFGTIIGDNSRTGIHTAIAPGMKIGSHCFVNSATLVTQDIPDGSFVKAKGAGELVIKPNLKRASAPEDRGTFRAKL